MYDFRSTWRSAATTTGIRLGFTCGTCNFINWQAQVQSGNNATSATNFNWMQSTAGTLGTGGSILTVARCVAANIDYAFNIQGIIEPVANTRLQLFFGCNGSGGAASLVTVLNQGAGKAIDVG
jgi:hypothetical protein